MSKPALATVWLDGCSGCHMSFLDMDERLIEIAERVRVVCTPYIDVKSFPVGVDIAIVEGAVSSEEDMEKIRHIRENTKILVALGDCAVTGNITAMRNICGLDEAFERAYHENVTLDPHTPTEVVPVQLAHVRPIHEVVKVDLFIPGCPPPADAIYACIIELLEGRMPKPTDYTRFGR